MMFNIFCKTNGKYISDIKNSPCEVEYSRIKDNALKYIFEESALEDVLWLCQEEDRNSCEFRIVDA